MLHWLTWLSWMLTQFRNMFGVCSKKPLITFHTIVLSVIYHTTHRTQATQRCIRSTLALILLHKYIKLALYSLQYRRSKMFRDFSMVTIMLFCLQICFTSIDLQQMFRAFLMHHSRTRPLTFFPMIVHILIPSHLSKHVKNVMSRIRMLSAKPCKESMWNDYVSRQHASACICGELKCSLISIAASHQPPVC